MSEDISLQIFDNLGLVKKMMEHCDVRKKSIPGYSVDDYFQEGAIVLWNAAEKFDEEKGFCFSTLACKMIENRYYKIFRDGRLPAVWIDEFESDTLEDKESIDSFIMTDNLFSELTRLIPRKHQKMGQALLQKMYEGYTISESADLIGITRSTAYYIIKSIRQQKERLPKDLLRAS